MTRWVGVAVGGLVCLALLAPTADRSALVAQAVGHLLAEDLDRAIAATASEPVSLFGVLGPVLDAAPGTSVRVRTTSNGEPVDDPAFERAWTAQLNRLRQRRTAARPPEASPEVVDVHLDVHSTERAVRLTARVAGGGLEIDVAVGEPRRIPGRASLLPPLLAIGIALALRRTLWALFLGVYAGSVLGVLQAGGGWFTAPFLGLWNVFAVYLRHELFDTFRIEIIGFVVALVAMIGVMSRAGGVHGLVDRLVGLARTARSALAMTYGMGLLLFFDDYANCMLVGSTMRPLTDRLRISREKLAYIVDSTAAPVAGISLVSTWIAFEVSVYSAQLPEVGIQEGGYAMFLRALPFRYYCLLTLGFVAAIVFTGRDFGPMARAERRARQEGLLVRRGGHPAVGSQLTAMEPAARMPRDWRLAAAPLALTLAVTAIRIFTDGGGLGLIRDDPASLATLEGLTPVLLAGGGAAPIFVGACSGFALAVWLAGSTAIRVGLGAGLAAGWLGGPIVSGALEPSLPSGAAGYLAFALTSGLVGALGWRAACAYLRPTRRPHLDAGELRTAIASGSGTLGFAVALLFLAWMIGRVCTDLATADYLVALSMDLLPPFLLPVVLFVAACGVSFATGSSWSAMSILLPNVVALAAALGSATELGSLGMVAICIGAVLDGSIFGDHCSPISDTTVLSSVASGSDHVDHVRTQIPYALCTAGLAIVCGYLPSVWVPGWGLIHAAFSAALGIALILVLFGSPNPEPASR